MKPTTSKRKYTWNQNHTYQLPARDENIHETNYQQEKIYMKPTTSKRKYTWNQLLARENIHETNYIKQAAGKRKYTWNQLPASENIHETNYQREKICIKPTTSKRK